MEDNQSKVEELVPELEMYVEDTDIGKCLRHPLVIISPYSDHFAKQANSVFKNKTRRIQTALKQKRWEPIIWMHERPYRLWAFSQFNKVMTPEQYWTILRSIWTDHEFPSVEKNLWLSMFEATNKSKRKLMTGEERRSLNRLPKVVDIYRGYDGKHGSPLGLSWTLSKDKAIWFADRFGGEEPIVASATCKQESIIALFKGRKEEEVIINPLEVEIIDNETQCA